MAADDVAARPGARTLPKVVQIAIVIALFVALAVGILAGRARSEHRAVGEAAPPAPAGRAFVPNAAQLATFTIKAAEERTFQAEHNTEGKIGVDEDHSTPIFSAYSGRVIRLIARQGDQVERGQVMFIIEATDMVQAQNDLIAAIGAVNKSRSQLQLAQTIEKRQRDLYEAKINSLRDLQQAQNDLVSAQNDVRAANGALEAVRSRLHILGKSEAEISAFMVNGQMSPETPIVTPLSGTVTQRRIGPGQFVSGSAADPAYTVGDLSTVWLLAHVRESDAPRISVGQAVRFRVLAFPDRVFRAKISYVASTVDPATRRVQVRAVVDNQDGALKPEMFARVKIATGDKEVSVAVPREAVIYEADTARLWVLAEDGSVSLRKVATGLVADDVIQILSGLKAGEKVITRGSLFIDRLASSESQ